MRLYLSSFRIGNCGGKLLDLTRGGTRAAVVANATDAYPRDERSLAAKRELDSLAELGFTPIELDLRDFFDGGAIEDELRSYDLVWARGGDTFTLRHSLTRSGADQALVQLIADDALVYGGYSAGVCVLAPTLRGLEAVDDPAWLRALYGVDPQWDGLGVLDYVIVPHVGSPEHPGTAACDRLAAHYRTTGVPHRSLRDGEVLIVDGDVEHLCAR